MSCLFGSIVGGAAVLMLAGCAGPTGLLSNINISGQTVPYPTNYREIVASRTLAVNETAGLAAPVPGSPYSAREPVGWYVCMRRSNGAIEVAYIGERSRVEGVISQPKHVCGNDTVYEAYTRKRY